MYLLFSEMEKILSGFLMTRIKRTTEAVESKAKCTFSLDCTPQTGSSHISFYDAKQ